MLKVTTHPFQHLPLLYFLLGKEKNPPSLSPQTCITITSLVRKFTTSNEGNDDDNGPRDFLFDQKTQRLDVLPNERLLWEHITRAPTEVALVHVRLEFVPKIDRGGRVLVFQKKSEVFHDCVCVVVRLQEPVCLVLHHVHSNLLDQVDISTNYGIHSLWCW